jgi:hypothetical protein
VNLNAAALKMMIAKGLTLEDVAEIVAANEVTRDPTAAERQARYRARNKSRRNVTRNGSPNESILTPSETPKPIGLAPSKKSDRGTRLPEEWRLPPEWAQWATEKRRWADAEIAEEALLFANYWHSRSGAGACHRDWFKTWQNWVIRSHRKDGTTAARLTRAEVRANLERMIPLYQRMGRDDDLADVRRKLAAMDADDEPRRRTTAIGSIANAILREARTA